MTLISEHGSINSRPTHIFFTFSAPHIRLRVLQWSRFYHQLKGLVSLPINYVWSGLTGCSVATAIPPVMVFFIPSIAPHCFDLVFERKTSRYQKKSLLSAMDKFTYILDRHRSTGIVSAQFQYRQRQENRRILCYRGDREWDSKFLCNTGMS